MGPGVRRAAAAPLNTPPLPPTHTHLPGADDRLNPLPSTWLGGPREGASPFLSPGKAGVWDKAPPSQPCTFLLLWLISSSLRGSMSVTASDRVGVFWGTKGQHCRVRGSGSGAGGS